MAPVTSLMIRRARLVPIGPAAAPPVHPVDVLVEDGLVTTVATQLDSRPGVEEVDADGRWCAPGLWDQHVHLAQWTAASQRLDLAPARSPERLSSNSIGSSTGRSGRGVSAAGSPTSSAAMMIRWRAEYFGWHAVSVRTFSTVAGSPSKSQWSDWRTSTWDGDTISVWRTR